MGYIGIAEHVGAAVLADIFAGVADEAVAFAGHAALYLAGCGEFEALLHTALGLHLGHFGLLLEIRIRPAWQPFWPARLFGRRAPSGIRLQMQAS